jgi:DNA polymerase-3 subunit beta
MKFTGSRQKLLDAFTIVGAVVSTRAIKPILQNLRMVVTKDGATLMATDLEVAIRWRLPLKETSADGKETVVLDVEEGGDVVIPVARVLGILRETTMNEVVFESKDRTLELRCGKSRFKVLGEDPEEFPVIPSFEDKKSLVFQRDPFRSLIRKTHFAAARERSRFAFNGVRLQVEGDVARMIATDGKRMAVMAVPVDNPDGITTGHIIPTKGLLMFERVLTEADATLRVSVDDRQVMIKTSQAEVSSRLVDGAFPKYESVIPKTSVLSAKFKKEELMAALRQAKLLTNEESRSVKLSFQPDKLILSSRATDVGEAVVEVDTKTEGAPIEVAFNPDFVIEGLAAIAANEVTIQVSGKDTPSKIDGEEHYDYVVMPVTMRAA